MLKQYGPAILIAFAGLTAMSISFNSNEARLNREIREIKREQDERLENVILRALERHDRLRGR